MIAALVCGDQSERREHSGSGRDENGPHPELVRECARVQRACAAERDEREVARIEALFDRDDAECAHHLGVDDLDHRVRIQIAERSLGCLSVELDPACEHLRQSSEQQVRVGHGRELAALPVARRTGIGARALGAHA